MPIASFNVCMFASPFRFFFSNLLLLFSFFFTRDVLNIFSSSKKSRFKGRIYRIQTCNVYIYTSAGNPMVLWSKRVFEKKIWIFTNQIVNEQCNIIINSSYLYSSARPIWWTFRKICLTFWLIQKIKKTRYYFIYVKLLYCVCVSDAPLGIYLFTYEGIYLNWNLGKYIFFCQ